MEKSGNILVFIDNFLIDRLFQKVADFLQENLGKSCFWIAKILYLLSIVSCLVCGILKISEILKSKAPEFVIISDTIGVFVFFCIFCFFLALEEDKKERALSFGNSIAMNSDRLRFYLIRIVYFFFFFSAATYLLSSAIIDGQEIMIKIFCIAYLGFFTFASYFSACTPFPGKKSRIKKWLESFKSAFDLKSLPALSPSRK